MIACIIIQIRFNRSKTQVHTVLSIGLETTSCCKCQCSSPKCEVNMRCDVARLSGGYILTQFLFIRLLRIAAGKLYMLHLQETLQAIIVE